MNPTAKLLQPLANDSATILLLAAAVNTRAQYTYTTLSMPGEQWTDAQGIDGNNIVGSYYANESWQGFLYDGTSYTTLNPPGSYTHATGISGGDIVGTYEDASRTHSFLATPPSIEFVPEPSSFGLLALGVAILLARGFIPTAARS
jgi:hypothetical protein